MRARLTVLAGLLLVALAGCSSSDPQSAPRHPPIVMIVFDEFSTVSLLDAHHEIDPVRYPNFAALARDGTWFPYATASLDETGRAMRSMVTGRTEWRFAPPTLKDTPNNLFVALGRRYRIHDGEETSNFCPPRLCPGARRPTKTRVLHELGGGRPERLAAWLRGVRPSRRPTFYFKHVLLPHGPWVYLPDGERYAGGASERRLSWDDWHFTRWLVDQDYQRHLLQLQYTDHLLGRVLAKLRATGLYDRSLIVVTADNGESFGRLGNGHEISRQNAAEIALTPLLIKLPGEQDSHVVARHVRTIDVLPTIAAAAHVPIGWTTEGRNLFGRAAARIPAATVMIQRDGDRITLSEAELHRRIAASVRLKQRLFGGGLFDIGPDPELDGTRVSDPLPRGKLRARVDQPVGVKVSGVLDGPGSAAHHDLAFAVDGTIVATAPTVEHSVFSVLLPKSPGGGRLAVYAIERKDGRVRLRALQQTG
jgi:Sulfatase